MKLSERTKQEWVGSVLGRFAQGLRRTWEFAACGWERKGWYANDFLAEYYVTRLCLPGRVFIDGGAHIGSITAAVLRNCPEATLVAVEAMTEKAEWLARKFTRARVVNCALAERPGMVSFYVDVNDTAWSSLAKTDRKVREVTVEARLLDSLSGFGTVDVIKLDLEGAELGALRGGLKLLRRDRPIIMYESGPTDLMGYGKIDMYRWLTGIGYQIFLPARLGAANPMSEDVYIDSHKYPFATLNYFAVPLERVEEVSNRLTCLPTPAVWLR